MPIACFDSVSGRYSVQCPTARQKQTEAYVNLVETFLPVMDEVFSPLKPSYSCCSVVFGNKGPCYMGAGRILLRSNMSFDEKNQRGGLLHETAHAFVEHYVHRPGGVNVHPQEALALALQIAALTKINCEWANTIASGEGSSEAVGPWLCQFARILGEIGFDPIRAVLERMDMSDSPVFMDKAKYVSQLNSLWRSKGLRCEITLGEKEGIAGLIDW